MTDGEKIPVSLQPPYDPQKVYDVPLAEIFADNQNFNVRGYIDPIDVLELSRDIRESGTLIQPITIQPYDKKPPFRYRVLAGHRRHAAYKLLDWKVIPSLIKVGITDAQAWAINLKENIQRKDLNVLQEAKAIEHLNDLQVSQPEMARMIGKSRGWVQERVYLLELPDDIQRDAAAGLITLKHVRHAWSLQSTQQQREYIKAVKDAKILKKARVPLLEKFRKTNEKRLRTKEEVEALQTIIRELFGNGIATRALGWAVGFNSDLEIHQYIAEQARQVGKFYAIPAGLGGQAKVTFVKPEEIIPSLDEVPEDDSDLDQLLEEAKASVK